ncbi:hypothetical protein K474DRAFT_1767616 [Panus rudis PR-1116 ss-1]|nr:hypothetical protein K474DRAFT_1767616 [Panus rudis PR-1116 ss-1]
MLGNTDVTWDATTAASINPPECLELWSKVRLHLALSGPTVSYTSLFDTYGITSYPEHLHNVLRRAMTELYADPVIKSMVMAEDLLVFSSFVWVMQVLKVEQVTIEQVADDYDLDEKLVSGLVKRFDQTCSGIRRDVTSLFSYLRASPYRGGIEGNPGKTVPPMYRITSTLVSNYLREHLPSSSASEVTESTAVPNSAPSESVSNFTTAQPARAPRNALLSAPSSGNSRALPRDLRPQPSAPRATVTYQQGIEEPLDRNGGDGATSKSRNVAGGPSSQSSSSSNIPPTISSLSSDGTKSQSATKRRTESLSAYVGEPPRKRSRATDAQNPSHEPMPPTIFVTQQSCSDDVKPSCTPPRVSDEGVDTPTSQSRQSDDVVIKQLADVIRKAEWAVIAHVESTPCPDIFLKIRILDMKTRILERKNAQTEDDRAKLSQSKRLIRHEIIEYAKEGHCRDIDLKLKILDLATRLSECQKIYGSGARQG